MRALLGAWALLLAAAARGPGAGARCSPDAAAARAMAADPQWRCAVGRARCLLATRRGSGANTETEEKNTNCQIRTCDIMLEEVLVSSSARVTTKDMEPKLFCRSSSKIVWHWRNVDPEVASSIFVVSVHHLANETWILHDVVSEPKFSFRELYTGEQIQLRVQYLNEDGTLGRSCNSKWIPALNGEFNPTPASNAIVEEINQFSKDYVNMSIRWEPDRDNPACDYSIWYRKIHDAQLYVYNSDTVFATVLPHLDFNSVYSAHIFSRDIDKNTWSDEITVDFTTPSCLDVWKKNLSICSPPPPENLDIHYLTPEVDHYDINMSWIPAQILPEKYIVYMMEAAGNRSEQIYVDANSTSIIFNNTKPYTIYKGCIISTSTGGNSSLKCVYRIFTPSTDIKKEESKYSSFPVIITLSVLFSLCVMGYIVAYFYHRSRSTRPNENLEICRYTKDSVEEPTEKNEDHESTTLYCADEWEISEDRLHVANILGEGAFGVVRRGLLQGQSPHTPSQEVAVKMIRGEAEQQDVEKLNQFRKEIDMMKSVGTHPNIVSLIGCCTHSKQLRLIVEYCDVGALHQYLHQIAETLQIRRHVILTETMKYDALMSAENKQDRLEKSLIHAGELLSYSRQIAMGMEFLSNRRIIHRDLAARNVLVCSNKTVKISDFGLSRDIKERNVYHKTGNSVVPVKWTAIESLKDRVYTTQSDVWSFGILLWEIVTLGAMPYYVTPADKVCNLLSQGYRLECPSTCSEELYDVMLTCWKAKPQERPTFGELYNSLDRLLDVASPHQHLNLNVLHILSHETSPPAARGPSRAIHLCSDEDVSLYPTRTRLLHLRKNEHSKFSKKPSTRPLNTYSIT